MKKFIPVENHTGLFRDSKSKAIINFNEEKKAIKDKVKTLTRLKLEAEKVKNDRINTIDERVSNLEDKIDKILEILTKNVTD